MIFAATRIADVKRSGGRAICAAMLGAALAWAPAGVPGAQATEFELTAGSSHPPILPWVSTIRDLVVPESNARLKAANSPHSIKWTEAYSGALYNFENTLEGIEDGLADIGWVGSLWEHSKMPLQNFQHYVPFAATDLSELAQIMDEMHETIPAMMETWTKHNQVYLGGQVSDSYVLVTKEPISSLADLEGLKVMVAGAASLWLSGTGAIAVNGGLPVFYNNINTGVADAGLLPGTAVLPFRLHEVAPHVTVVNFGPVYGGGLAMNMDTWNKLPKEVQDVFTELGKEYRERVATLGVENRAQHFTVLEKEGAIINELSDELQAEWARALPNIAGDWAEEAEKNGLPGKEIVTRYMEALRERGTTPLRDWDKEL